MSVETTEMPPVLTQEAQTVAIVAAILYPSGIWNGNDEDQLVEAARRITQKALNGGGSGYFVHSG
jgi:hypothetical protein